MGEVYVSELLSRTLPEWVPYLIWYTMKDMKTPQGARQIFELTRTNTYQHIRHTQAIPAYENSFEFETPDAVNATVIVKRGNEGTVMMLKCEENE